MQAIFGCILNLILERVFILKAYRIVVVIVCSKNRGRDRPHSPALKVQVVIAQKKKAVVLAVVLELQVIDRGGGHRRPRAPIFSSQKDAPIVG